MKTSGSATLILQDLFLFRTSHVHTSQTVSMDAGETWLAFGPPGSGRTRLFEILTGLNRPLSGSIKLLGFDLEDWKPDSMRRHVAWVSEEPFFLRNTIRREIQSIASMQKQDLAQDAAEDLLEELAPWLIDQLESDPARLEPDEKLAVDLVRRIVAGANFLLVDEQKTFQAPVRSRMLMQRVSRLAAQQGINIILATSNPVFWELPAAQGMFLLGGLVRAQGLMQLLEHQTQPFALSNYLQHLRMNLQVEGNYVDD